MPILKIFKGNIANQLCYEKEAIKNKIKQLRDKKAQMAICKRDMEDLTLAESLVQLAKSQMLNLSEFDDFMDFIHNETNLNIDASELFSSIDPSSTDIKTNLFAQFDYMLNNTNGKVKSLKDWYPYLYEQAYNEYHKLYSEISAHQMNIYTIANDAINIDNIYHNEIDMLLQIAKSISYNVNKLLDIATQYFGTDSKVLNEVVSILQEQEETINAEYQKSINEDLSIDKPIFETRTNDLSSNMQEIDIPYMSTIEITIMSNVIGKFSCNANEQIFDTNLIHIDITTGGIVHKFKITNNNLHFDSITIDNILTTFTPSDLSRYSIVTNYNILTAYRKLNLNGQIPTEISEISWDIRKTTEDTKYVIKPTDQHYYIEATYKGREDKVSIEVNKNKIIAYNINDTEYNEQIHNFYIIRGKYNIYYKLDNGIETTLPMTIEIL